MKYRSTKTYKEIGPVAYRQWRDEGNCHLLHGYALSFHFEFECDTLDFRNWCVDFGGLRPLKDQLEDWFDHVLLVAEDDPQKELLLKMGEAKIAKIHLLPKLGCESLADMLYEYVNEVFLPSSGWGERVWCYKVEVREKEANSAMRVGHSPITPIFVDCTESQTTIVDLKNVLKFQNTAIKHYE